MMMSLMAGGFLDHLSMRHFLLHRDGRDHETVAAGPYLCGETHHRDRVAVGRPKVVVRQAVSVSEDAHHRRQVCAACQQVMAVEGVEMLVWGAVWRKEEEKRRKRAKMLAND